MYQCSENKGADQLRSYCAAHLRLCFRICKKKTGYLMMRLICRLIAVCNKSLFDQKIVPVSDQVKVKVESVAFLS